MALSENFASVWETIGDLAPDRTAVVVGDERIDWSSLDDRAARLASAFVRLGVRQGTKVAQLLYNCREYVETVYATFKLRAEPVNINYRYVGDEIAHVLTNSDTEVLVCHSSLAHRVAQVIDRLPGLKSVIVVDDGGEGIDRGVDYEQLLASSPPAGRISRSGDDMFLMYTGGTTGMPKGVVWRHGDMITSLAYLVYSSAGLRPPESLEDLAGSAARLIQAGGSPVHLIAPPLMHGTAMSLATATFCMGGTVVLLAGRHYEPVEVLTLIARERVTQLTIVGDAFARPLVGALQAAEESGHPFDLSSLERITSTGATFSAEFKRGFMRRKPVLIVDAVAASEGGPMGIMTTAPGEEPGATAVFNVTDRTVLLEPVTMDPYPTRDGRPGLLAIGGIVPLGYYKDPERTAAVFREIDGVRYSAPGDFATIDIDGMLHLLGRGSACINTAGEKVYPEEVEVAARSCPGVFDCMVVGRPDPLYGESVTLVASRTPGSTVDSDQVISHVKGLLAHYKAPRHVVWVDEVPRSPSGKANYRWAKHIATTQIAAADEP